jgi:hypothetical protein
LICRQVKAYFFATMTRIEQHPVDWHAGYTAGISAVGLMIYPPEVADRLAYANGFIEGEAARERAAAALRDNSDGGFPCPGLPLALQHRG